MYLDRILALEKLVGKKVKGIRVNLKAVALEFNDGSELVVEEKSGPGADNEWHVWTKMTLSKKGKQIHSWDMYK